VASGAKLLELFEAAPPELRREAFMHASWTDDRAASYGRLAFLGDSVLGLSVASELFARYADSDIGPLTKIHNQAVSGRSCAEIAVGLGFEERLAESEPDPRGAGIEAGELVESERAMASVLEAVIGACYLTHGFERTAVAVVEAFAEQIEEAASAPADFKSALQELLASRGARVRYDVVIEEGPAHSRRFEVTASVGEDVVGRGVGRSKKAAEQVAAEQALEAVVDEYDD
jgi:ribonuclease-3